MRDAGGFAIAARRSDAESAPRRTDELVPLVYNELRRLASGYLRAERLDHTLQTTALVHEAYLRLIDQTQVAPGDQAHFMALAARAMRQILVQHARGRKTAKRGGRRQRVPLDELVAVFEARSTDLVALDEALGELSQVNERRCQVVELRFFGGLAVREIADALSLSTRTVEREWRHAKAWLRFRLSNGTGTGMSAAILR